MKILAHRGWWLTPEEKNSRAALIRAFEAGYGIETDLRDHEGQIVIAHDMPVGQELMSFEDLLALYRSSGTGGTLALNIKADGLQDLVAEALSRHGVSQAFVFDMAVPDAIGYLRKGITTYTRHSEYEPVPPFYDEAQGVWVDCFKTDWIDTKVINDHVAKAKAVALVSPELHRRPHQEVWDGWRTLSHESIFLCTDFPGDADTLFNGKPEGKVRT